MHDLAASGHFRPQASAQRSSSQGQVTLQARWDSVFGRMLTKPKLQTSKPANAIEEGLARVVARRLRSHERVR
jgi:hypothetical protein